MSDQPLFNYVPQFYRGFLPAFFQQTVPEEKLATCQDCAMCPKKDQDQLPGTAYYSPTTKCCTYHPFLPNYLVGGLLLDGSPSVIEGRRRLQDKIRQRVGVIPHGIEAPPDYPVGEAWERGFGRDESLLCPYYERERGLCTVWSFRESNCGTFFCRTVSGHDGWNFWRAFRDYLSAVQVALAGYALRHLNWRPQLPLGSSHAEENIAQRASTDARRVGWKPTSMVKEIQSVLALSDHEARWGNWLGREEELYKETFRIVSKLSRRQYGRIIGSHVSRLLAEVKEAREQMINPRIPARLKRNPTVTVHKQSSNSYLLVTDWRTMEITEAAFEVLCLFDECRSAEEVIDRALREMDVAINKSLLISFYRSRLLIAAE